MSFAIALNGKTARIGIKALSALLAASASTAALAQTVVNPSVPPIRSPVDERGVNLATGQVELTSTDLSIGDAEGGLKFTRYWNGAGWRNNYLVSIAVDSSSATVIVGDSTTTYSRDGTTFTSRQGDGSTLVTATNGYTYTAADGTVITFTNIDQSANYYGPAVAVASKIAYPTGEELTLDYRLASYTHQIQAYPEPYQETVYLRRLQSVRNNLGLQLKFSYAANTPNETTAANDWYRVTRVTAINNAVEACDPVADSCSLAQNWQKVDYAQISATQETVTDALNHITRYTTDGSTGKMVGVKMPRSSSADTTIYSYTNGKVSSVSNGQASWGYSWAGTTAEPQVTVTDPLLHANVVTTIADQGVVKGFQDALGRQWTNTYDSNGRLSLQYIPGGGLVQYVRDDRGNAYQTYRVGEGGTGTIGTSATYPSSCVSIRTCNKPTSTTDGDGKVTNYEYDANHGGVTKVTLPSPDGGSAARPEIRYTYEQRQAAFKNAANTLVSGAPVYRLTKTSQCITGGPSCAGTNSPNELVTTYTYGPTNNPASPTSPNNLYVTQVSTGAGDGSLIATTAYGYDSRGNRTSVDGPLSGSGDTSTMFYDDVRQLAKVVSPNPGGDNTLLPRAVRYERNADDQVTATIAGTDNAGGTAFSELQRTTTAYDSLARKISDTLTMSGANYAFVQYGYDAANRATCTAQRMTPSRFGAQSDACTVDSQPGTDGPDRITRFTYYNDDQVQLVQSAYGTSLQQNTQAFTYNATSGKLESVTDVRGNRTSYGYDVLLRPVKTSYPSSTNGSGTSSSIDYEQLTYNNRGLVTNLRARDGQNIGFGYDDIGRLMSRTSPSGTGETNVTYGYDNLARLTSATDNVGVTVTRTLDALGRMKQEAVTGLPTLTYDYDLMGRRIYQGWGDTSWTNYDYYTTGELWRVRENGATSGVGLLAVYAYDNLGRRTGLARGNGTSTAWGYAGTPWLASLTHDLAGTGDDVTRTFNRSAAGEIRQATSTNDTYRYAGFANASLSYTAANGLNQYSSTGAGTTFDYDGRGNLTSSANPGQSTQTYGYTADNRLVTASGGSFQYDPLDRLFKLTASNTRWRYGAHGELVGEYDVSGNYLRRYVHGDANDEPLVWYEGNGVSDRRHLHADERGSIVAVSNSSAVAQFKLSYDEHGVPAPSNANGGRFQYTGQTWLAEIGAYNYKARIYSPKIGRFLQTDPVGYADHMNVYAYVGGDPINRVDPTGLADPDIVVNCESALCFHAIGADILYSRYMSADFSASEGYGGGGAIIPPRLQRCTSPNVSVTMRANDVRISTSLRSNSLSASQLQGAANAINARWSGQFAGVNVTTSVSVDMANGRVVINGYPGASGPGGRGEGPFAPNTIDNINTNLPQSAINDIINHEFGHFLGLPDRYHNGFFDDPGYAGNIMSTAGGKGSVSAADIANALRNQANARRGC